MTDLELLASFIQEERDKVAPTEWGAAYKAGYNDALDDVLQWIAGSAASR